MIIGMRGHDFGRMQPEALADAIRETGFAACFFRVMLSVP